MSYTDRIRTLDTWNMTAREVAGIVGCKPATAGVLLRNLKKPFRRLPPCPAEHQHEHAGPDLDRVEREWARLMRGRSYDSHIIRRHAATRLPGPELTHTAGGTSAGTCAEAGESFRRVGQERTRDEIRAGVRRLFEAGHNYGDIAERLGLTRHRRIGTASG